MKTKLSILSALVCIGSAELLAGTNFDQQMSLQEKQQTGVVNLTLKQRMALASWIDNNYTSKTPLPPNPSCREAQAPLAAAQAPNSSQQGPLTLETAPDLPEYNDSNTVSISMILMDGQQISLSNDSRWLVYPQDISIAALWLSPSIVKIHPGVDPEYNYYMTNTSTNQTIRVKKMAPGQTYANPLPQQPPMAPSESLPTPQGGQ